jgi:hypothetical protein
MSQEPKRKHWSEYPIDETCYGQHKYGFGVYHLQGKDYWLDWESATDYEKQKYREYLKSKGYEEKEGSL